MPKNVSYLEKSLRKALSAMKSAVAPYTSRTRKNKNVGGKTIRSGNKGGPHGSKMLHNNSVKRGGGKTPGHSTLRANAKEFKPYAKEFPALGEKIIWPGSKNYAAGKKLGSKNLGKNNVKRGGRYTRRH